MYVVYLAACTAAYLVPSSLGENIARLRYAAIPIAILTLSLRRWRPLPLAVLALSLAVAWNLTPLAGSFVKTSADPAGDPAYWAPAVQFLAHSSRPLVPGRGGRHRRPLAGRLPAGGGDPDRAGMVPAERFSAQRRPLHPPRPSRVPGLAPLARRSVRRPAGCTARLQRQAGGRSARARSVGAAGRVQVGTYDRVRRSFSTQHRDRARDAPRAHAGADEDHPRARTARPLPHRGELVAVLAHGSRLPLEGRRRNRPPLDDESGHRPPRPLGQCETCSGSPRR